jgi:hypothetical protein
MRTVIAEDRVDSQRTKKRFLAEFTLSFAEGLRNDKLAPTVTAGKAQVDDLASSPSVVS